MGKHLDSSSILVIALTLLLSLVALFTTGFTHDLLLEAGIFLVSVKLILMAYKISVSNDSTQQKLDGIHSAVQPLGRSHAPEDPQQPTWPLNMGRIAPGMGADIVLLAADPLVRVKNLGAVSAVVRRSRYLPRGNLDQIVSSMRSRY